MFETQTKWFSEDNPVNTNSATNTIGSGDNGTITITVDKYGTEGNDYTVEVVIGDGASVDLSAELTDTNLVITLATDSEEAADDTKNTATLVTAAIEAIDGLSAVASGTGATALSAAEESSLFTGGTYATFAPIPNMLLKIGDYYYTNTDVNTIYDSNWKRFQLSDY